MRHIARIVGTLVSAAMVLSASVTSAFAGTNSATVTVHQGQTLWTISRAYHLSLPLLTVANPTIQPKNLLVGTVVRLPNATNSYSASKPVTPRVNTPAKTASVTQTSNATTSNATANSNWVGTQNLYWMEHVINAEAGGESLQAQIAVGDTILHRMKSSTYANTVKGVVFQVINGHYQFTSVANGYVYTAPNASSIAAAKAVLQSGKDFVPGAMVFYNPAQTPASSWVRKQPTITTIGKLRFAR